MLGRQTIAIFLAAIAMASCTSGPSIADGISRPADNLPQPKVVIEAVSAPPFTYWAPAGSTIRNHPRQSGVWIAEVDGQAQRYYFGDQCHTSRYQNFIGQPVEALPAPPSGAVWRVTCSTCAVTSDLGWARMNIAYDEDTRRILEIGCG